MKILNATSAAHDKLISSATDGDIKAAGQSLTGNSRSLKLFNFRIAKKKEAGIGENRAALDVYAA